MTMPDDEATREFIVETREGLDQLDREFVALEADPTARERIATVFRTIHTIKGTSAFLGFSRLEKVTHVGENLLALLRDGSLKLTPPIADVLLALVDRVRGVVASIEANGTEGTNDHADLIARLVDLRSPAARPSPPAPPPPAMTVPSPAVPLPTVPMPAVPLPIEPLPVERVTAESLPAEPLASSTATAASAPSGAGGGGDNVRIDVRLLDDLMDIVGELVLARNQILQVGARLEDQAFLSASQRLNLITTELQEQVMKTRMQPIGSVWSKLPRVVRDLAVTCGKQVRIEMLGKETELDRTILEAVKDPLTHIVRNSIDHGLEPPQARIAKGKPRTGTLTLRAFHAGGQVNIEVSDDGGGLDLDAIQRKAIERELITPEQAARMDAYELGQLVFAPGFSTAKQVTNVSGRGVGMDVVKTNIERIGGTVEIVSAPGKGTTIKIRIPLTLAIVPALIVAQNDQRYAIPQANLVELVRVEGSNIRTAIEMIHGAPVYRLRGQLLPIVYLGQVLGRGRSTRDDNAELNIIVLQAEDRLFGVVIDEVRDTEEIVVKPLGKELKGVPMFAGATIMGDGRVALILDVQDLARHAGMARDRADRLGKAKSTTASDAETKQTLLLFTTRPGTTVAIPLSEVARLEEFAPAHFEVTEGQYVVQHRGGILPLIDLAGIESSSTADPLPVIVYASGERSIGLVVQKILDVVDETIKIERVGARSSSLGAAVIQGKVTELLDLQRVIRNSAPWFFEREEAA